MGLGRPAKIRLAIGVVVAVAAAAVVTLVLVSGKPATAPAAHARVYLNTTACLLTNPSGVAPGGPGAPVWAAMQKASVKTHVMVSYLPATGPAEVPGLLNSLVERRCGVIVATGTAPDRIAAAAKANPHQQFILVVTPGTAAGPLTPNTQAVSAADAPARIGQAIQTLAAHAK
jgi:basic membrane lipoprotein Med (substrate-binding protein (PBP1-ABC) superfamily)